MEMLLGLKLSLPKASALLRLYTRFYCDYEDSFTGFTKIEPPWKITRTKLVHVGKGVRREDPPLFSFDMDMQSTLHEYFPDLYEEIREIIHG